MLSYVLFNVTGGFTIGPLNAKIDWSGWTYSDELLAALTPENLGGMILSSY